MFAGTDDLCEATMGIVKAMFAAKGIDPKIREMIILRAAKVRSIGQISRFQRIVDNDADYVKPLDMISELRDDNSLLTQSMREVHSLCDEAGDVATASLLENWIDESEKRIWFLFECGRHV
jgi:starvation-inducible DNA-binding protein